MKKVIQLYDRKAIEEKNLTAFFVNRIMKDAGIDADLKDDGAIVVSCRSFNIRISVGEPGYKMFYGTTVPFRARLSLRSRLAAANRINGKCIGAAYVEGNDLRIWSTLFLRDGILAHNIINTIREFQTLVEAALGSDEMLEVLE